MNIQVRFFFTDITNILHQYKYLTDISQKKILVQKIFNCFGLYLCDAAILN